MVEGVEPAVAGVESAVASHSALPLVSWAAKLLARSPGSAPRLSPRRASARD